MSLTIKDTFLHAVNAGLVPGHRTYHKFGRNDDAGTSLEDIMYGGGILTLLQTAQTMEAISASVNDTAAGSHARKIQIDGVNQQFQQISEEITMNGTSASSATSQSFLRVYRARLVDIGTYNEANDGNITIRISGAGATQLIIEADSGVSQTTHYTVPAGETAYLLNASIEVDASKSSRIILAKTDSAELSSAPFKPHEHIHTWDGVSGPISADFHANHIVQEKTDIWAESVAGAINTALEFNYSMLLIKNEILDL